MSKIFVAVMISLSLAGLLSAQDKSLSDISKLRAENFKLRSQLLRCNVDTASKQLEDEKKFLESQFKRELNAKDIDQFNWDSLSFPQPK